MTDQQTDGPNVPYQPSSGGPHPTLAGNMFDPNVQADGAMSGSQEGVGGQDERTMHAEGLEHIKNKAGIGSGAASSTTSSTTATSTMTGHPPSTNPSAEDPSGGIPAGAGGVSSSAHKMSPVDGVVGHENESQKSGLLGSTLAYLGLGGSGGSRAPTQPDTEVGQNADAPHQPTSGSGVSGGSSAAAVGAGAVGAGGVAAAATAAGKDNEQSAEAESAATSSGDGKAEDSKPQSEESSSSTKPQEKTSHEHDSQRENRDAIPLAGGEKIGGKSWGSSKIVPDNPKPRESTQVSSEEGQGDKQTQNNTSSNQGDAKPPQQHINENKSQGSSSETAEKHGLAEKMKERLHIGSHHK
ncbi:hypothetical protein KC332_g11269 [Hortaea werneckii]|uniref:Uncharacterized protein n=2 Tax=Hortaea werneckii TaxID=91943 RepID=A0A3M7IPT9_HORWE|nr:hypothetical protein KC358_g11275 [Hortaea werneckii]OTA39314.1 hypothetical protein BTJ68_00647 [Hortaea werneckii EXF-2000]KAI6816867.1 hypothetical protein KC350_g10691 [Hortaea werneckii]KAI6916523.1 hypothetical protein KC348_g11529 [Hortaea werneckii]KAI6929350.1 hypothetical protein KC341_g10939 [Hortaea werneckii]